MNMTLCIICRPPSVLLGMKKRGFGAGRWNGFGGKVNKGETVEEAAKREVSEESGLLVNKLEKVGIIEFSWQNRPEIMRVHIYRVDSFENVPVETEEMRPRWFLADQLPYANMWPDDKFWLPLLLAGRLFKGKFTFNETDMILKHTLKQVKNI